MKKYALFAAIGIIACAFSYYVGWRLGSAAGRPEVAQLRFDQNGQLYLYEELRAGARRGLEMRIETGSSPTVRRIDLDRHREDGYRYTNAIEIDLSESLWWRIPFNDGTKVIGEYVPEPAFGGPPPIKK